MIVTNLIIMQPHYRYPNGCYSEFVGLNPLQQWLDIGMSVWLFNACYSHKVHVYYVDNYSLHPPHIGCEL